jgi:hypothetical protein
MGNAEKVREDRLRRRAGRQGLRLQKSRRRDPRALDYGTYQLVNARTGEPERSGLTLDEAEKALTA